MQLQASYLISNLDSSMSDVMCRGRRPWDFQGYNNTLKLLVVVVLCYKRQFLNVVVELLYLLWYPV